MPMDTFDLVFSGFAVLFTLLFIISIRSFLKILPQLGRCIGRYKANLDLEDSLQLSRSRNLVAMVLFVPFCMTVHYYGLYSPAVFEGLQPLLRFAIVVGVMLAYMLLRTFLNWQLEMHSYGTRTFTAANRSFLNFGIILFLELFCCGALLLAFTHDPGLTRTVLLWIAGISYLVYIFRRGQIFSTVCNPFATFLYLCGLELLPTGGLVLSAVLL